MLASIDQSLTKTAICIFNKDKTLKTFKIIKSDKNKEIHERIESIVKKTAKFLEDELVEFVAIEGLPFNLNSNSVRPLAGLYYYFYIHLSSLDFHCETITPTEAKKTAIKGNASKEEMIKALPKDVFIRFSAQYKKSNGLEDLADAYFIGMTFFNKFDIS